MLQSIGVPLPLWPRLWLEARRMQTLVRSSRRRSYLYVPWFDESVMAAAHFNRIAKERQLPLVLWLGASIPIARFRRAFAKGWRGTGLLPRMRFRMLSADEASAAATVFAFDEVPPDRKGNAAVIYWRNVPAASKDYSAARDAIVRRVEEAAASLASKR